MDSYQAGYYLLFNAVTDVIRDVEKQNYGAARETLIAAQQAAEEAYITQIKERP